MTGLDFVTETDLCFPTGVAPGRSLFQQRHGTFKGKTPTELNISIYEFDCCGIVAPKQAAALQT
ncbi:hypothetical protein LJR219_002260 [Phenylobacterium sp. LjRoot219]|uniref:hypothetical protein n=1 Tax=Phenylobacterium sp. LjRoot219 TaxID=3342283 RepID=UPI003ECDD40A